MTDFRLVSSFSPSGDQPRAISGLLSGLRNGLRYQTLLGVTGSGKTYTMANVIASSQCPALILAPNKTLASQLYAEMASFFPDNAVEYFVSYYDYYQPEAYVPARDLYIEKDSAINDHIDQMRLSATKSLLERSDVVIVATVSSIYGIGDPKEYHKMILTLRVSQKIAQEDILKSLIAMQYTRTEHDFFRGHFRVRGDVIDVFPSEHADHALRIQLFDGEIESLSFFDAITSQVKKNIPFFSIYPASHYVTPRDTLVRAMESIKIDLARQVDCFVKEQKLIEASRLEKRTRFDLEMLNEIGFCKGIENYSLYFSNRMPGEPPPTLLDYLPSNALIIIDESHITIPQIAAMSRGDQARKDNLVQFGYRLPSARDNRPLTFSEFEAFQQKTIFVSATPAQYEQIHSQQCVEQLVRPTGLLDPLVEVRPASNQLDDLLYEIRERVSSQERVLVTTLTKKMAEHLSHYLSEKEVRARYLHSEIDTVERAEIIRDLRLGVFDVLIGINLLREGLDIPEVSLVAILDADKEGFLRSTRSLIQTIGRAARHLHGQAILYADQQTESIKKTLEETNRRRLLQEEFNRAHGVVPVGVKRALHSLMDNFRSTSDADLSEKILSPSDISVLLKDYKKKMIACAKRLEFEEAASWRNKMNHLRDHLLGVSLSHDCRLLRVSPDKGEH